MTVAHDSAIPKKVGMGPTKGYKYFLDDSAADSQQIHYYYLFEYNNIMLIIGINKRKGIFLEKQKQARCLEFGLEFNQVKFVQKNTKNVGR